MGRISQTFISRVGEKLAKKYPDKFTVKFDNNKKSLDELIENGELDCPSKRIRNRLAGFLVNEKRPKSNVTYRPAPIVEKKQSRRPRRSY